jgi:hypothetical protein
VRTTIDLPNALYRKIKATAALRGTSMKQLIIQAVEAEVATSKPRPDQPRRVRLPITRSWKGPKLNLSGFDFDELSG